ncbi:hypothetical protein CKM354_000867000 [Cercospora kikuchii]|uniref:Uncharacterized protein n=1 Tax=Cercospora kikuchii TaxID=84275 RepID=A0A9P3CLP6_9PEZI|nr:uncharacterized protein CKM354_000867000 [Cercospora kikuchii]GIZ45507.1 hypothetical protein CKM354_000867000 [Cercospora kikuchii]
MASSKRTPPMSFFDLPRELRDMIYAETFPPFHELNLTHSSPSRSRSPSSVNLAASHPVIATELAEQGIRSYEVLRFEISPLPWSPPDKIYRGVRYITISFEHYHMSDREAGLQVMIENITKVVSYLQQYKTLETLWVAFAEDCLVDPYWSENAGLSPFGFPAGHYLARIGSQSSDQHYNPEDDSSLTVFEALLRPLVNLPVVKSAEILGPDGVESREELEEWCPTDVEVCGEFMVAFCEGLGRWVEGERGEVGLGERIKREFEERFPAERWDLREGWWEGRW